MTWRCSSVSMLLLPKVVGRDTPKDTPTRWDLPILRAAPTGDGLESLVLLAVLTRVGKPKIDIAIQARVRVILGRGEAGEWVASSRLGVYPWFVHRGSSPVGQGPEVCLAPAGPFTLYDAIVS